MDGPSGVNGFVGYLPSTSTVFVVFRGSENVENWVVDADLRKTVYPFCEGCEVHEGFLRAHEHVIPLVKAETGRLLKATNSSNLVITGHSLGAAIATLVTVDLQTYFNTTKTSMYNFGSPRLFNIVAAEKVSSFLVDKYRFTHFNDLIPHFPFLMEHYEHITPEIYEDLEGNLHNCVGPEDKSCAQQWPLEWLGFLAHYFYLDVVMLCPVLTRKNTHSSFGALASSCKLKTG